MKFDSKTLKNLSMISQIGLMMSIPIIGCILLGSFIDDHLHTAPIFLIIFIILGVLASFRNLFVIANKMSKSDRKDSEK